MMLCFLLRANTHQTLCRRRCEEFFCERGMEGRTGLTRPTNEHRLGSANLPGGHAANSDASLVLVIVQVGYQYLQRAFLVHLWR